MQKSCVIIGIMVYLFGKSTAMKRKTTDMCPYQSDWKIRGLGYCGTTTQYHCLEMQGGGLVEVCIHPITIEKGFFPMWTPYGETPRIYQEKCRPGYYNDGVGQSNTFYECKKKSECKDDGQISNGCSDGGTTSNRQCRCDYENNYISALYQDPKQNPKGLYCFTLKQQTSSCYKFYCQEGFELDRAYRCVHKCEEGKKRPTLQLDCVPIKGITDEETPTKTDGASKTIGTSPAPFDFVVTPSTSNGEVLSSSVIAAIIISAVILVTLVVVVIIIVVNRKHVPTGNTEINLFGGNAQIGDGGRMTLINNGNLQGRTGEERSNRNGENINLEDNHSISGHDTPTRISITDSQRSSRESLNQTFATEAVIENVSRTKSEPSANAHDHNEYLCLKERTNLCTVLLSNLEFYNKINPKSMNCEKLKRQLSDHIDNNDKFSSIKCPFRQYEQYAIVKEWKNSEDYKTAVACGLRYDISVGVLFEDGPEEMVMIVERSTKCICLHYSSDKLYSSRRSTKDLSKCRRIISVSEDEGGQREKHALLKKAIDDRIRPDARLFSHFKLFASIPLQGENMTKYTSPLEVLDAMERHHGLDVGFYPYLKRILEFCDEQCLATLVCDAEKEMCGGISETIASPDIKISTTNESQEQTKMFQYNGMLIELDDNIVGDELDRFTMYLTSRRPNLNYLRNKPLLEILIELGSKGLVGPDDTELLKDIAENLQSGNIGRIIEKYDDSLLGGLNSNESGKEEDRDHDDEEQDASTSDPLLACKNTSV